MRGRGLSPLLVAAALVGCDVADPGFLRGEGAVVDPDLVEEAVEVRARGAVVVIAAGDQEAS